MSEVVARLLGGATSIGAEGFQGMDTRYLKKAAGMVSFALLMLTSGGALASDAEAPNPFAPATVHKESVGERWRHSFHDIRTTWDKYFETYAKDLDGFESADFFKVRATPVHYLERKIQFNIYMGRPAQYFRPFLTPFTSDQYTNFTAWGYGTELWTKEGRTSVHPFFYVDRRKIKLADKISALPAYAPYRVWAIVRSTTENLPWFEVQNIEAIPETPLTESTLRHIELGSSQLAKKRFDLAARSLEAAVKAQLPVSAEVKVYTQLGQAYSELRNYSHARNALVNAILRDNKNVANLVLLARTDLKLQKADEAKQAAEAAIALEPANALAYAELGLALAWLDDIKGAYKALDHAQILGRNQLPEAFRNRAMVALREGKLTAARDELNQAVILRPTDVDLKLELGDVYVQLKEIDKAKLEFSQARDLAAQRAEPYYKLASVLKVQADELQAAGKGDDAKKLYEEALESVKQSILRDDSYGQAYTLRSELLRALGRPEESAPSAPKAEAPGQPLPSPTQTGASQPEQTPQTLEYKEYELSFHKAQIHGDFAAMERLTRDTIAATPSGLLYSRLGLILATKPNADLNGSVAAYQEAVRRAPDRGHDWAALGNLQLRFQKNPAEAETSLSRAVQLDSTNGLAWSDLALAKRQIGNNDGAILAAEQAARNGGLVEAMLTGAQARMDRGGADDVAASLEMANKATASATNPRDIALAHSVAATALMRQGKIDEAIASFAKADSTLRDNNAEHLLGYGLALLAKGDNAGQEKLKAAIEMSRNSASADRVAQNVLSGAETALRGTNKSNPTAIPVSNDSKTPAPAKGAPVIEENEPLPVVVPGNR